MEALSISYSLVCYKVIVKQTTYTSYLLELWFCLYYIVFRFLITKFNFKTPGREDKAAAQQVEATEQAQTIVAGLGGKDNIEIVDCCATRLRVTLNQNDKVDKSITRKVLCAKGVIQQGTGVQVIYGPHVTVIKNEIEESPGIKTNRNINRTNEPMYEVRSDIVAFIFNVTFEALSSSYTGSEPGIASARQSS